MIHTENMIHTLVRAASSIWVDPVEPVAILFALEPHGLYARLLNVILDH
jgi:hypothetical protein